MSGHVAIATRAARVHDHRGEARPHMAHSQNGNGHHPASTGTIAAVLPGGGARGAYEIGALSVLLPALQARGERVEIWCGTSVGAINAAALSSFAHLPAEAQADAALALWDGLHKED